jgi:anti-sigma B factor antagonist
MSLPISITGRPDGVVQLRPQGEIGLDNAYLLRDAVTAVLTANKPRQIRVELDQVTFIDSVGIGILVSCFYAAAACGSTLVATAPQPAVHRQLWVCGVAGLFALPTPSPPDGGDREVAFTGVHRVAHRK